MDDVIYLIKAVQEQDARGVWQTTPVKRRVFCTVNSISRAEFFEAGRSGLNPSFMFRVFAADYDGEDVVEYQGRTYGIYRTYKRNGNTYVGTDARLRQDLLQDYVELYAEGKGGTNAGYSSTDQ